MEINKTGVKKISFLFLAASLMFSLAFPPFLFAEMQDVIDSKDNENIFLYVGDLVTVKVHSLTRIAVGNPGFVDVTTATADEIVLIGRKVGETPIFIWDELGKHRLLARVLADDLGMISERLTSLIQTSGFKGLSYEKNYYEGKIVLSGSLPKDDKKRLEEVIKEFNPYIINLVKVNGDLIEVDMQISELSKTLNETLGIDWTNPIKYTETLPNPTGKFKDLFKLGDFNRSTLIEATVNALITEGKGRILSKPSVVVTSGEEASFNVGGEIPIKTTTSASTGTTQENVTFKDYGIDLTVTPEIKDGKIDIKLQIAIRDIDSANAVGENVAFTTRKVNTRILVNDGQLIVLAGLIKRSKNDQTKRVPFVSRIPVVGLLFKSHNTPTSNSDLELVISLRPRIYAKNSENQSKTLSGNMVKEARMDAKFSSDLSNNLTSEETLRAIDNPGIVKKDTPAKVTRDSIKAEPAKAVKEKKNNKHKTDKVSKNLNPTGNENNIPQSTSDKKATADNQKAVDNKSGSSASLGFSVKASAKDLNKASSDEPVIAMEDTKIPEPQNVLSDEDITKLKSKYSSMIKKEMSETISYPLEAKENKWEGTVTLDVTVSPDGNVKEAKVNQSSGRDIFDKDALNTVQILSPYDSFAPAKNLREITVTVPIEYNAKTVLGSTPAAPAK